MKQIKFILLISIIIYSCAKISRPSGGPKDIDPPVLTYSNPPIYSSVDSTFDGEIVIEFDEIIKLKDITKEIVISPPLIEKPIIKTHLQSIEINLNNKLYAGATYTINFGNSVTDNNEGNVLKDFRYIFSTGESIDSMEIAGNILDSYSLKPNKGFTVMLYTENVDSLPYNQKPRYIAKTDKDGRFRFTNIKKTKYKLFAITDNNNNYQYDPLQGEKIAFLDSLITPSITESFRTDTTIVDSLGIMYIDSVFFALYIPDSLNILSFNEANKKQFLLSRKRKKRNITFQFNQAVDTFDISPTNIDVKDWSLREFIKGDSIVNYWITDSTAYNNDSLSFIIKFLAKDSIQNEYWKSDTVFLRFRAKVIPKGAKYKPETLFKFETGLSNKKIHFYKNPTLISESPIVKIDTSLIHLYKFINDSTKINVEYKLVKSRDKIREITLYHKWEEGINYSFNIDSTAFKNVNNLVIDSTIYKFAVSSKEEYGNIMLKLDGFDSNYFIQLIKQENIIDQQPNNKNNIVEFKNIIPGEYQLRAILDNNHNNKWDTGLYLKHIQPEKVIYYREKIKVIKNWDLEELWELKIKKK